MSRPLVACALAATLLACKSSPEPATATAPAEEPPVESGASPEPEAVSAATVVTDADARVGVAPSGKAKITHLALGQNAFLGKLEMEGGGKVPVHRDATEEYIYILEGNGVMTIDGKQYEVGPNTAIYMPANAEVSFEGGGEKLVALQVFAGPQPAAKYDAWAAPE